MDVALVTVKCFTKHINDPRRKVTVLTNVEFFPSEQNERSNTTIGVPVNWGVRIAKLETPNFKVSFLTRFTSQ